MTDTPARRAVIRQIMLKRCAERREAWLKKHKAKKRRWWQKKKSDDSDSRRPNR